MRNITRPVYVYDDILLLSAFKMYVPTISGRKLFKK